MIKFLSTLYWADEEIVTGQLHSTISKQIYQYVKRFFVVNTDVTILISNIDNYQLYSYFWKHDVIKKEKKCFIGQSDHTYIKKKWRGKDQEITFNIKNITEL